MNQEATITAILLGIVVACLLTIRVFDWAARGLLRGRAYRFVTAYTVLIGAVSVWNASTVTAEGIISMLVLGVIAAAFYEGIVRPVQKPERRVFIAGPAGQPEEFLDARNHLIGLGLTCLMQRHGGRTEARFNMAALLEADTIVLLNGWDEDDEAQMALYIARALGLHQYEMFDVRFDEATERALVDAPPLV